MRKLLILTMLFLTGQAEAAWGTGCASVGAPVQIQAPVRHGWVLCSDGKTWAWFDQGVQIGWYEPSRKVWRDYDHGVYGMEQPPPWARCRQSRESGTPNFGLVLDEIGTKGERYIYNGREITRAEAERIIGRGGELKDDSNKLRFTVIGPEPSRKKVLDDLHNSPALAAYKDKFVEQSYPADHWATKCGFKTDGNPTIYVQKPDGKVLMRRDSYEGPEELASALRRTDPSYDPSKDPSGKPKPLSDQVPDLPPEVWAGILLVAAGVVAKMKKS